MLNLDFIRHGALPALHKFVRTLAGEDEITLLPDLREVGPEEVIKQLEAMGYKRLSGGFYGTVLQDPRRTDVVTKVARADRGYLTFVDLAMKHQDNPWYPQIYSHRVLLGRDGELTGSVTTMEKLAQGSGSEENTRARVALDISLRQERVVDEVPPHLRETASQLVAAKREAGVWEDLHEQNVMHRPGTAQMVITDPFFR